MKQTLYIDPRIRDNVFLPLILLMVIVSLLRFFVTKLMNSADSPLLQKASLSIRTLKKTILEKDANFDKDEAPGLTLDIPKVLEEGVKANDR